MSKFLNYFNFFFGTYILCRRDCVSISAYFAESGDVTWSELIENPPPLSDQFLQFIHCVGWPVSKKQKIRGQSYRQLI